MTDDEHQAAAAAELAERGRRRRGTAAELAAAVLYGLITLGVTYAVSKPDQVAAWIERARARPPLPAGEARARRLIAELRSDLAQIERGW